MPRGTEVNPGNGGRSRAEIAALDARDKKIFARDSAANTSSNGKNIVTDKPHGSKPRRTVGQTLWDGFLGFDHSHTTGGRGGRRR